MTRIAVNGAEGRMGQRILALAAESGKYEIAGKFDAKDTIALSGKGVLIDFSSSEGTLKALEACRKAGWGLVVGTTGLDDAVRKAVADAAHQIPVVLSANMSVGVNVVLGLLEEASRQLPNEFKIHITEAHHIHKKDAPSGTAIMLADAIARIKNWNVRELVQSWKAGKYNTEQIGMKVIREGEIVGDHTVSFQGPAETVEISHHAASRDTFARGSLLAATFLSNKPAGLYSMRDVLSVK